MRTTKNLIVSMIMAACIFAMSCEENAPEPAVEASGSSILGDSTMTDDWQEYSINDLPQNITDFIANEFSDKEIKEAWLTDEGEFILVLDEHLYLIFDSEGNFIEKYREREHRGDRDPIDPSNLPQAALDYLSANHPDAEIKKAFTNEEGEFIVKLNNRMVVIFDSAGNFIEEFEKEKEGRERGFFDRWEEVDVDELPDAIIEFVEREFADEEIVIAGVNDTGKYALIMSNYVVLLFDSEGDFMEQFSEEDFKERYGREDEHDYEDCDEVTPEDLPEAALAYLAEHHADETIEGAWVDEDEEIYIVELSSDVYVIFDLEGNHIETKDCDG